MNIFEAADGSSITVEDVHVQVSVDCDDYTEGNSARFNVTITSKQQPLQETIGTDLFPPKELQSVRFTVVGQWEMQSLLHQFSVLHKLTQPSV